MKHYMIALWRLGYVKWLTLYTSAGAAIVSQWVLLYNQARGDGEPVVLSLFIATAISIACLIIEVLAAAILIDVCAKIYEGFIESHVLEIKREAQDLRRSEEQRGETTAWEDEG